MLVWHIPHSSETISNNLHIPIFKLHSANNMCRLLQTA
ncbi:hypothetical protein Zm00014a_004881 [Zea mays]|uniref:Uncharacterized protein n=1 Tax=Zea mays TaxID=4577 RepID=A0A3L6FUV2_MAIZE|nr:hypothetical protein Zm00014a_004881 [Zea mays]